MTKLLLSIYGLPGIVAESISLLSRNRQDPHKRNTDAKIILIKNTVTEVSGSSRLKHINWRI